MLLLQLVVMLSVALLGGNIAKRLRQPAVFGELIGGIILGPTILGSWWPDLFSHIFHADAGAAVGREWVVKLGLLSFLFVAGTEIRFASLHNQLRIILGASISGIIIPFCSGLWAVHSFPSLWDTQVKDQTNLALFIGPALSISALPVISRILISLNLIATKLGTTIMSSAVLDDLVGWTIFAVILKNQLLSSIGMETVLEKYLVFIAFWAGAIFRAVNRTKAENGYRIGRWVVDFVAPIYFVAIGLKVNFISNFDGPLVLTVFVIACVGKIVGVTLGAAVFGKASLRESLAIGFAMNARGAMEIVLASIALDYHLIDERIFVSLVLMALGTSILSGVMLKRLVPLRKN
jgi:Kef-type K+ transport system membrane component KefB